MTTLNQLLNCALYDEQGTRLGQVSDALLNKKSGKCLLAVNSSVYGADKFKFNDDGVVGVNMRDANGEYPSVVGKGAYDMTGKLLGIVADGIVGKTTNVVKLILDNGKQCTRGQIASVKDIVLIKTVKSPTKKKAKTKTEQVKKHAEVEVKRKEVDTTVNARTYKRRYGDFSFLLGKTADKNITNFFGEVMIHCGETVTLDVLRQAKLGGKLIELCLHVK